ncbi:hypothetical protein [Chryseobacterium sp. 6424]|uniref:hypothetical protein n=1 Tax=Chryseobacterium sp. 6424 TaxID=2039166 RepID=UPI0013CEDAC2|nr:hypothetical protein [Chryseobacterium sp. 6424]
MKKYLSIMLLALLAIFVASCDDRDDSVDNDTYPLMRDITGSFNAGNSYTITQGIDISTNDVVLVYRNINSGNSNGAVWQLIPKTEYLGNNNELDYNYLFDSRNIEIYTEANFDQATLSATEANTYLNNQRFRIVLVPANQAKNANANIKYTDYQSVLQYYNIPDRP